MALLDPVLEKGRVRLTVTAVAGTLVTVTRQHPSGRILPVRGMNLAPLSGGVLVGWDYEMPVGVQVTYIAAVYDSADTNTPLDISDAAVVTWNSENDWLKDPLEPIRNIPVLVNDMTSYAYTSPTAVHEVLGRPDPVTVGEIRQAATGTVTFYTDTWDDRDRMHYILASGHVLLLQSTQQSGVGNMYIAPVGDMSETRVSPLRDVDGRLFSVPYQEVGMPAGDAGAFTTWADVLATYSMWTDVIAQNESWLAMIEGLGTTSPAPILTWRGA